MADIITLTDEQEHTLRHMLGINVPDVKAPESYRNYYCANVGDETMQELARLGLVRLYRRDAHYDLYICTDAGKAAAFRSHRKIRRPKAARRYARFLQVHDVCPDLTFREFLTDPAFQQLRSEA